MRIYVLRIPGLVGKMETGSHTTWKNLENENTPGISWKFGNLIQIMEQIMLKPGKIGQTTSIRHLLYSMKFCSN